MIYYEIENLTKARSFLKIVEEKVALSNALGSTRYYGMRVIDYMFKTLSREFPNKIERLVVNCYDDYAACCAAKKMGYQYIQFVHSIYIG